MADFNIPQPTGKVLNFDQLTTLQQAIDYASGGYHASDKQSKSDTPVGRLWKDAAGAYAAAYLAITALNVAPNEDGVAKAKTLLHDANHAADEASAAGKKPNA